MDRMEQLIVSRIDRGADEIRAFAEDIYRHAYPSAYPALYCIVLSLSCTHFVSGPLSYKFIVYPLTAP